ncbi:DNA polymerase I, thermostable [Micromonospora sp. MW-13]|uniref:DNA polymerase n=1 Tax=Micromonospora sp. MW-13 TaxID=2094022 RepID=UPI000EEC9691|nr:DNA polymerase [Micromonospora sp. MW-13]RGC68439.1 DNA polymerase I, thermostable [Micromonospora sp. MW-13]
MTQPYADGVADYALAGWTCILPVPVAAKWPPPVGYTGADGRDTDPATLTAWAGSLAAHSIALRMPDGVIGLDVDHYDKVKTLPDGTTATVAKRGADSLAEYEQRWGALPPTWRSSARQWPSGIRFYRVPAGRYAANLGDAIEVIQRHHRYAVVWPSVNPDADAAPYRWYDPTGAVSASVPKPNELPELPDAWVAGLREGATEAGPAASDIGRGQTLLTALMTDHREPCAEVADAARKAVAELHAAASGSRHDTATARTHHLVQLGATGHPGAATALLELREQWCDLTAGEGREGEFDRMLLTSARKAVTVVGTAPVDRDPCFSGGEMWAPATPGSSLPGPPLAVPGEAVPWSVREVIGAHTWDPRSDLDHGLSAAVLARMQPVLRYAVDAGAWLLRGPDRWDVRGDLTKWAVHELAELMPRGDAEAEKGSDERRQADRRKRLMMTAGRNGVAATMNAAVAAGTHPCSLRLGDLDTDPGILWAGGVPWDLRASTDRPVPAWIDHSLPHLHSASVAPADVPTPLWDTFLEVVWPDPEVRAWAIRVLAIAVTGVPDAALPILLGPERRGKSQVVHLLMTVLGSYALSADPRLLGNGDNAHASIVYALLGRRLAFIDEGPREGRWAQERLKQLTGGTALTGNAMRTDPVTFNPTHTLVLTANDEPPLTDPAVRARVRLIPCEGDETAVRAARRAIGDTGGMAWRAEAPGVLWRMIIEAARWIDNPDSAMTAAAPEHIRNRADLLAADQDPIQRWITDLCEPYEPGTKAGALHESFVGWCRNNGIRDSTRPTMTKWGRRLTELNFPPEHRRDGWYRQLRVTTGGGFGVMPTSNPGAGHQVPLSGGPAPRDGFGDGLVTGSTDNPSHPKIPAQGTLFSGDVTGVTGCTTTTTTTSKNIQDHKDTEILGETGGLAEPVTPTPPKVAADLDKQGSVTGFPNPSPDHQPATESNRPARRANPTTGRYTKAAQKEAEREQARRAAAGELVPLPVAVDRVGTITGLTPAAAGLVIAEAIARAGALTVDVETSGYPVGHANAALRTVQLGDEQAAVVLDPADPVQAEVIRTALAAAPRLHAHSATADLVPLAHAGLLDESAWDRMFDTVIPAKLADPTSTGSDPGLKQLAGTVLGEAATAPEADKTRAVLFKVHGWLTDTKALTPVERSGWAQVDSSCATMIRYAASDVLDTAALAVRLPQPPPAVTERERAVQRITARVTHRGLRVDHDQVTRLEAEHTPAMHAAADRIRALGVESAGSDRQLAERLTELGVTLPRTQPSARHPQGQPSVAAGVLDGLKATPGLAGDLISAVLDYRHHETVLTTFLEPYRVLCEAGDGRARPTVYTLGTDTGRMSCVRPNLQQLPREGGVRACITADPGHVLVSADFSGVEIRVMAALSQDPELIRQLREGVDLHALVAELAFGPGWTKANRYTAKRGVFGWAYGGGIESLARQLGVSAEVMQAIVDALRQIAPDYVAWADEMKRMVRSGATQMPTYAGRVIHLPREYPHKAANYAIQGTARELLVDALLAWDQTCWTGGVVLPVHDEIVAMVPEADAEAATTELVRCMSRELYGISIVAEPSAPSFAWKDSV